MVDLQAAIKSQVSCTILGQSFTLSCNKEDEEELRLAITLLQDSAREILGKNPNLSPMQAAILTALKAITEKKAIEGGSSPFLELLDKKLSALEKTVKRGLKC